MVDNASNENQIKKYRYPLLIISAAIVVAIGLIFAIGRPLYADLKKTAEELRAQEDVLAKKEEKLSTLKSLQDKEEELKKENQKLLAAIPEDKDVSRLFAQFEKIARESGVKIESVQESSHNNEGEEINSEYLQEINYNISATAPNYSALKKMLSNLEGALRLLSVSAFDAGLNNNDELSLSLTITTYQRRAQ